MITKNIILILLYCLRLSFQKIQSGLFCDDRILRIYRYDESLGRYILLKYVDNPADCNNVDYIDLDVSPGDRIKFECRNDAKEALGGGCFLINNQCKCYDFHIDGNDFYYIGETRNFLLYFPYKKCSYKAKLLKQNVVPYINDFYHDVPLDATEIKCNPKDISAPINIKSLFKFSEFIESPFYVKNLKITVDTNYQIFSLNNETLSPYTKFNILSDIECFSNQSSKINIQFTNYGIELGDNKMSCELNIRFCYDSCLECNDIEPNESFHQCLKCKDDFYFIENTNNCMKKTQMNNSHYYFDNNSKIFRQCLNECSTCDNGTYCTNCRENFHFIYNAKGKCISKPSGGELLFLYNKTNTYMKCPEGTVKVENNKCIEDEIIKCKLIIALLIIIPAIILIAVIIGSYKNISKKDKKSDILDASLEFLNS